ncbi:segregation/condensation protein A [Niameybacter massiliensis]|uniref:Segregation and condensation protein A n=1 Tax=Holtiella tumoricola TaxID=3018743 RepID=A0AA42DPL3_9FIRM|nr:MULTISPECIES: segregation/condensation protein A [Lachnospirales]MDA3732491.1 segregation/condensation protein A [Holtiella tumoricola]
MSVTFKLEDFEGPLDLLLYLLEKNKMSICDIEISSITDQYLAYIESSNTLELEQMSEFIVMAATLLYIKSKMLLPKPPKNEEVNEEDPREELIRKLLEYKKIKYVSHELDERQNGSSDFCFRNHESNDKIEVPVPTTEDILIDVTLEQLYEAFQNLMKQKQILVHQKSKKIDSSILKKDTYTIEQKALYILNLLELNGRVSFFELCTVSMPKVERIVTFMSILELVHKKQIRIVQEKPLADIIITGVKEDAKD